MSVIASKTDVLCNAASTGTITVAVAGGLPPYLYKLGSGAYQSSGSFASLSAGSYTITIQDANLCIATASATIVEPAALSVDYTTEPTTCPITSDGRITLIPSGGVAPYTILWSDGSSLIDRSGLPVGEYSAIITDNNGCSKNITADLGFSSNESCLEVQEILTPNNDGFYDVWKIKNVEMYPDAEVKVYNRWGELVFSSRNVSADAWDGTFKGKLLPTDSYHFVLYLGVDKAPVTGTITIIR
jgi:gliding motility-associated-like protein